MRQLRLAMDLGLNVPRTLVSQQPQEVRAFCADLGGAVVAKKLSVGHGLNTASIIVTGNDLACDSSICVCPAIYQELIHSQRHLRVNCFGSDVHAFVIQSEDFDWRLNLNVRFNPFKLDGQVTEKLIAMLGACHLEMGIFDMVLLPNDEIVWLELNPQGQFLFCEALSGSDLIGPFTDFLAGPAYQAGAARPA